MAELTVETTYGKALYDVAVELNQADAFLAEIQQIKDLFAHEPEFYELIKTPVVAGSEKKQVVEAVFSGRISPEILNFLYILIDKRRASNFGKIVDQYRRYLEESKGSSTGVIYSAELLDQKQLLGFEQKTSKLLLKKVTLENRLDASLLGGVKIMIEGKIIDASIRKRLEDLQGSIKNA